MHQAPPIQLITPLMALKRKRRKTQAFTAIVLAATPKSGFSKTLRHTKRTSVHHPKSSNLYILKTTQLGRTKLLGVVPRLYQAIQIFKDRAKPAINAAHYAKARNIFRLFTKILVH